MFDLQPPRHIPTLPKATSWECLLLGAKLPFTDMSAAVQVFGCRHDDAIHALRRPASEKRQGTKSREVGHRRCRGRYGDLAAVRDLSAR